MVNLRERAHEDMPASKKRKLKRTSNFAMKRPCDDLHKRCLKSLKADFSRVKEVRIVYVNLYTFEE